MRVEVVALIMLKKIEGELAIEGVEFERSGLAI